MTGPDIIIQSFIGLQKQLIGYLLVIEIWLCQLFPVACQFIYKCFGRVHAKVTGFFYLQPEINI